MLLINNKATEVWTVHLSGLLHQHEVELSCIYITADILDHPVAKQKGGQRLSTDSLFQPCANEIADTQSY